MESLLGSEAGSEYNIVLDLGLGLNVDFNLNWVSESVSEHSFGSGSRFQWGFESEFGSEYKSDSY